MLVVVCSGRSTLEKKNCFDGWQDSRLTFMSKRKAKKLGQELKIRELNFDYAYVSMLPRATETLHYLLKGLDSKNIKIIEDWHLNERSYGALEGLNKNKFKKQVGAVKAYNLRRGVKEVPPKLNSEDSRNPKNKAKYQHIADSLPTGESLEMARERFVAYFEKEIKPNLADNDILLITHKNMMRAIIQYLDKIDDVYMANLEVKPLKPYVIEYDNGFNIYKEYFI